MSNESASYKVREDGPGCLGLWIAMALGLLLLAGCASPTPSPVIPLVVESEAPAPRDLPRTIGLMFDWGEEDYQTLTGGVPVSAVHFETWDRVSPGPGQFNSAPLDEVMARYRGQTVTLLDGTVISKPVVTQLMFYISSAPDGQLGVDFSDRTPQWVYNEGGVPYEMIGTERVGYALNCTTSKRIAEMPRYDSLQWWAYWFGTVQQFAQWAANQPQVVAVVAAVGLDGETQPIKQWGSCNYPALLPGLPGVEYRWGQKVVESMSVYGEAFGPTGIYWYLNNAPGGMARPTRAAQAIAKGGSLKHSGGVPDVSWAHGVDTILGSGSWDYMRDNRQTVPLSWESAYDIGAIEQKYWSIYAMLGVGWPALMDLHSGYFPGVGANPVDAAFLKWAAGYLSYQPAYGPGAWIVLRDAEEPCAGSYCWWPGDFSMGVQAVREGPRVWRAGLPVDDGTYPGRQCRMIGEELALDLDDALLVSGSAAQIELVLLNYGTDTFSVGYQDYAGVWSWTPYRKGSALGPVNHWVTVTLDAPNLSPGHAEDVRILAQGDGAEYVHRMQVWSNVPLAPTVTPIVATLTTTPSATGTASPSVTVTPSRTMTQTATRTIQTLPPSATLYPTYTRLPSLTPRPTYTALPSLTPRPTPTEMTAQDHMREAERLLEWANPGFSVDVSVQMEALP